MKLTSNGPTNGPSRRPSPEELEAYLQLGTREIARLVLCLLIEEGLASQLASFRSRPKDLPPQPIQGQEEFLVAGRDVVPVRDRAG